MMKKLSTRSVVSFVGAFVVSAIVASAGSAGATGYVRLHASACMPFSGTPMDYSWGIQNDSTTSRLGLLCPVPMTNWLVANSINLVQVEVTDSNNDANSEGELRVSTCYSVDYIDGGVCSTTVASTGNTGTGAQIVSPSAQGLASGESTFAYVYVDLPKKDGTARSSLRGLFIQDY